jgi:hypothetical protein
MTDHDQREMDALDRAIAALSNAVGPEGPSHQLIAATVQALEFATYAQPALARRSFASVKSYSLLRSSVLCLFLLSVGCGLTLFAQWISRSQKHELIAVMRSQREASASGRADYEDLGDVYKVALVLDPKADQSIDRKIIRTATLDILVADFDKSQTDLEKLIEEYKGHVAQSDFNGNIGSKRTGTWTVRVPAERFESFRKNVIALGQPQRNKTDANDVTEEFVDLQADIKSLKDKEAKLNELMKAKAQSFKDIIIWQKEDANVRAEIARKEARLQTISRLTAMSTANITLRDEKEVIPQTTPPVGPSSGRTFRASLDALAEFGQFLLISVVALAPWLPLVIALIFVARLVVRHFGLNLCRINLGGGGGNGAPSPP